MKFHRKSEVVEATQWFKNGDHPLDYSRDHQGVEDGKMRTFAAQERKERGWEGDIVRYFRRPDIAGDQRCEVCCDIMDNHGFIETPADGHRVCPGDWIITGCKGDVYPCKPDVFAEWYEPEGPTRAPILCDSCHRRAYGEGKELREVVRFLINDKDGRMFNDWQVDIVIDQARNRIPFLAASLLGLSRGAFPISEKMAAWPGNPISKKPVKRKKRTKTNGKVAVQSSPREQEGNGVPLASDAGGGVGTAAGHSDAAT